MQLPVFISTCVDLLHTRSYISFTPFPYICTVYKTFISTQILTEILVTVIKQSSHSIEQVITLYGVLLFSIVKLELLAAASRSSKHLSYATNSPLAHEQSKQNNSECVTFVEMLEHETISGYSGTA